jgi:hypothetical protein
MLDDPLERRLRVALRAQGDQLPFTITAAELERRLALRGSGTSSRRIGLLLAAAMAIGLFGAVSLLAGLASAPTDPSPDASARHSQLTVIGPSQLPVPSLDAGRLPELDDMIEAVNLPTSVLIAHGSGPADAPPDDPFHVLGGAHDVELRPITGWHEYRVTLACLGGVTNLDLVALGGDSGVGQALTDPCDGRIHELRRTTADATLAMILRLQLSGPASWRVVVHGFDGARPTPGDQPATLSAPGEEHLISFTDQTMESPGSLDLTPTVADLHAGAVVGRAFYRVQLSCVAGPSSRAMFGEEIGGAIVPSMTLHAPCDGATHEALIHIPRPGGSPVYVEAAPGTRWSLLISSAVPPVSLTQDEPGWRLAGGIGPDLGFENTTHEYSGLGASGGGPFRVSVACAGTGTLEVTVDVAAIGRGSQLFIAECTPEGGAHVATFQATAYAEVQVAYGTRPGLWTALTLLVPEGAPLP